MIGIIELYNKIISVVSALKNRQKKQSRKNGNIVVLLYLNPCLTLKK